MKTAILIVIATLIVIVGIRSLYNIFKNKGGCSSCSSRGTCMHKDKTDH